MRFFHISDLHIGKTIEGNSLYEDMRHILLNDILGRAYDQYKPEALVIAGDIYDKANPAPECIQLFEELLDKAVKLGIKVFIISGNHDNAVRVSYGRNQFRNNGIYISEPFSAEHPYSIVELGGVNFCMLPFASKNRIQAAFPKERFKSSTEAHKYVLDKLREELPKGEPSVLIAHQGVNTGNETMGFIDTIDISVFEGFTYTALGHYHSPQSLGEKKNVRYCGTPLMFTEKEIFHERTLLVIDIDDKGELTVTEDKLQPLRKIIAYKMNCEQLLSDDIPANDTDFVFIQLTENPTNAFEQVSKINVKFPNHLRIRQPKTGSVKAKSASGLLCEENGEASFDEVFRAFLKEMLGETEDELHKQLLDEGIKLFGEVEENAD
ncbi:MAG: exonuclease SbcCD subunit D [Oscillospiraceae bacterium]